MSSRGILGLDLDGMVKWRKAFYWKVLFNSMEENQEGQEAQRGNSSFEIFYHTITRFQRSLIP